MRKEGTIFDRKLLPIVAMVVGVTVGVGALWTIETTRPYLIHWMWVLIILALAVFVLLRRYLGERIPPHMRAAMVIFVGVPALLVLVGSVTVLPQKFQLVALRATFLVVVCLLPAILWYLFIATRKASLLNEFLTSLDRLGLLRAQRGERVVTKERRVSSYLQRFGAIYGELPEKVHTDVQRGAFSGYSKADVSGDTGLTTTAIPVMMSTALIALGWLLTLPPAEVIKTVVPSDDPTALTDPLPWIVAFTPTLQPVTLAFIGAYFFCIQMLFRRYALKDLRGSAYVSVSMRIILATIGVWVLSVVNTETGVLNTATLYALSFAIGVFPLIIWQFIQYQLKHVAGFVMPSMKTDLPVSDLDGLTVWHESRLEEEDIENLPNMATADIVDLLLNTRLAPNRIIDWADQAILYTQLGPARAEERRQHLDTHGIRTASAFLQAAAEARRNQTYAAFEHILVDELGTSVVGSLETAIRTNCNLQLVLSWRGIGTDPRTNGDGPIVIAAGGDAAVPPSPTAGPGAESLGLAPA